MWSLLTQCRSDARGMCGQMPREEKKGGGSHTGRGAQNYTQKDSPRVRPGGRRIGAPRQQNSKGFFHGFRHHRCAPARCPRAGRRGGIQLPQCGRRVVMMEGKRGEGRWHRAARHLAGRGRRDLAPSARRHDGRLTANRQATDSRTQEAQSKGRVVKIRDRSRSPAKWFRMHRRGQVMGLVSGQASAGEKKETPQSGQEEEVAGALSTKKPKVRVQKETEQGGGGRRVPRAEEKRVQCS
jgi:hypothetical protein